MKINLKSKSLKMISLGFVSVALIIICTSAGVPPFSYITDIIGKNEINDTTIQLVTTDSIKGKKITITLIKGKEFNSKEVNAFGFKRVIIPQFAIWIEDLNGNYIQTLYVTERSGKSNWRGLPFRSKDVRRPAALPYWSHKRGIKSSDGIYMPDKNNPVTDAITGATPSGSFKLTCPEPSYKEDYYICLEINKSFDYNEYFTRKAMEDPDKSHAEKNYSGQPALVYQTKINTKTDQNTYLLELIGHSDPIGASGEIYKNINQITTAQNITKMITIKFE